MLTCQVKVTLHVGSGLPLLVQLPLQSSPGLLGNWGTDVLLYYVTFRNFPGSCEGIVKCETFVPMCVCVCVCVCVEIVAHFYEIPPVALDKAPHLPTINVCTHK